MPWICVAVSYSHGIIIIIIIIMKTYYAPVSIKKDAHGAAKQQCKSILENYYDTTRQWWNIKYYFVRPTCMWRTHQKINQHVK